MVLICPPIPASGTAGPTVASPPTPSAKPPCPAHGLEADLVEYLRSRPDEPMGVLQALNAFVASKAPKNRSESRAIKSQALASLGAMARRGLIRRGRTYLALP
jgi:hypothetical protein